MPTTRLQDSIFGLTFQRSSLTARSTGITNYGTVFIKSSNAFYGPPSGSFGLFHSTTSPHFPFTGASISSVIWFCYYRHWYLFLQFLFFFQAVANSYVCIPGILNLLQALFPNPATFLSLAVANDPIDPLDVKLIDFSMGSNNHKITDFELVFFLNNVKEFTRHCKRSVRFGRMIGGSQNVLQVLSRLSCAQRSDFSVYIEYRTWWLHYAIMSSFMWWHITTKNWDHSK